MPRPRKNFNLRRMSVDISMNISDLLDKIIEQSDYDTQRAIIERGIVLVAKEAGVEQNNA